MNTPVLENICLDDPNAPLAQLAEQLTLNHARYEAYRASLRNTLPFRLSEHWERLRQDDDLRKPQAPVVLFRLHRSLRGGERNVAQPAARNCRQITCSGAVIHREWAGLRAMLKGW
jgi:hypothetical protein